MRVGVFCALFRTDLDGVTEPPDPYFVFDAWGEARLRDDVDMKTLLPGDDVTSGLRGVVIDTTRARGVVGTGLESVLASRSRGISD